MIRRPGFTLLEVALATALGALVVLVTAGVFVQIDRTETILSRRADESNQLANLRLVAQRIVSTLVMSNDPLPPKAEGETFGSSRSTRDSSVPLPVPRLILEADPRAQGVTLVTDGNGEWKPDSSAVQRLEVVLADSPVPEGEMDIFAKARRGSSGRTSDKWWVRGDVERASEGGSSGGRSGKSRDSGAANGAADEAKTDGKPGDKSAKDKKSGLFDREGTGVGGDRTRAAGDSSRDDRQPAADPSAEELTPVRAVRGALELRRQPLTPREARERISQDNVDASGVPTPYAWEVWWVPLPPRALGSAEPSREDIGLAGEPYLVAQNIVFFKWEMYDDDGEKTQLKSTWQQQLPAYVRLTVATVSGMTSKWMFEINWGRGPEVPPAAATAGPKRAEPVGGTNPANQDGRQPAVTPPTGLTPGVGRPPSRRSPASGRSGGTPKEGN